MEENKAKVEKISLKELKQEKQNQEDEIYKKKFDAFIDSFNALSPEEKEIFFKRNS